MVLAAGRGTRLRPLTDMCAKPLLPVGDRPAIAHVLGRMRSAGVERIVVNAHHRAADVVAFARAHGVEVSEEPDLLGTAGGVARAAAALGPGDAIVWNGDILADVDVEALVAAHARDGAVATLVVRPRRGGEGSVGVDAQGWVVRLRSESFGPEAQGGDFVGVSVLGAWLRSELPERGCLVADAWIPALRAGRLVRALAYAADFYDIGTPERYWSANMAWLKGRGGASFVGAGASVAPGVSLDRCVVGEGAAVAGAGTLAGCVVWPGGRAVAPLSNAIVAVGSLVVTAGAGANPGTSPGI
jgi:mannose-1-phosphate guanylyltransferase